MKFSQRIGKVAIRNELQVDSIDESLKNRLWNVIHSFIFERKSYKNIYHQDIAFKHIWKEFFILPLDEIPTYTGSSEVFPEEFQNYVKFWFYKKEWYELYDLIEFLLQLNEDIFTTNFSKNCNLVLKKEGAGYRIIENRIVQITSEEEIQEIEEGFKFSNKFKSVYTHLNSSFELLSSRTNPDYRNSIKESISAVEAFCRLITKNNKATLGDVLKIVEKKYSLHKALKKAFSSLYGYTSDSSGIRHSLLEDDIELQFEDAKFMFVSCISFINYLKMKI